MSNIEWTDATWNPVVGCSKVSPGCAHCYAETISHRFGTTRQPWTEEHAAENVVLHPERLTAPLHWRKPRRVFVNSMSDLFHEQVPDLFILEVWLVMAMAREHTFQILTKRPERMREILSRQFMPPGSCHRMFAPDIWPLPNVWLGVSVENQHWAYVRIPELLETPAAVRFLSCEPLLGPLDLTAALDKYRTADRVVRSMIDRGMFNEYQVLDWRSKVVDWVIIGGESGPKHRPFDPDWARDIVRQCRAAGVPPFMKQLGGARPGARLEDLPPDLRIREYPDVARLHHGTA